MYPARVSSILHLAFHRSEATPRWNLKPCIPLYRCGLLSSVLRIIRISGNNKNAPFNVFLQFHLSFSKIRPHTRDPTHATPQRAQKRKLSFAVADARNAAATLRLTSAGHRPVPKSNRGYSRVWVEPFVMCSCIL